MESAGLPPPARPGPAATQQEMVEADLLALGELAEAKAGQVVAVLSLAYILRSCCATIELGGDCSGLDQSNLI
jgi:hypothetical protein